MEELVIATRNSGKAKEFTELFKRYEITVKSLLDLNQEIADVEETGSTFKKNAQLKAETIAGILRIPVLADDSGLAVNILDGRPGVYSARFAGEPKNDQRNNEKLLNELAGKKDRSASFICVLSLAIPNSDTIFTEGECAGQIAEKPAGMNGFGYDPLFIPKGYSITMAELDDDEKNNISHRYHALTALESKLKQIGMI